MFTIKVKKLVVSDRVSCINKKDWQYIEGYHGNGEKTTSLFIKTKKNKLSNGLSQHDKDLAQCFRGPWNEVDIQSFEKLEPKSIKRAFKDIQIKPKIWKNHIKTKFLNQKVPYDL